jgi:cation diffusion facilitator family transporter
MRYTPQGEFKRIATRTSWNTIAVNVLLSAFKLYAGVSARSSAMLSDAVHSISDVFSTIIVIIGVRASSRVADERHPYGHERFESVAAILLAVMLGAVGAGIGRDGVVKLLEGDAADLAVPGPLALGAAVVSIAAKECMYWYTRSAARRISSGVLMADAWHHRSDALSSVGSFAGILGARAGYPLLDPAASVVICCFILKMSVSVFVDAIRKMTDESCDAEIERRIGSLIVAQEGVLGLDSLQTRKFGERIYVDVEIRADGDATLRYAHEIAEQIHDSIEAEFPMVKHCMVHVNPAPRPSRDA